MFHGVLFGLLLVLIAVLPAHVCLARVINIDGKQLGHRVIELGTNAGSWPADTLKVSFHHNLVGYFTIYSSVLLHGRAQVPE